MSDQTIELDSATLLLIAQLFFAVVVGLFLIACYMVVISERARRAVDDKSKQLRRQGASFEEVEACRH